ncbi:phosphatase PAP2 family protein [Companilactobacillus jidongensis]|uniref:phosphatase PAP2 family protein n=1 Tax=Companilactobacillus jidongensis TaxID=2486006 RepID=UPI0013DE6B86|nr:phosphatase PAP2 family protein [Companilactobacillus jidongensis]
MDAFLFRSVNDLANKSGLLNALGVFTAQYTVYILALIMIGLWFVKRNDFKYRQMLSVSVISCLISELVGKLIAGNIYYHRQPFAVWQNVHQLIPKTVGNSFPSDHTIVFFSIMIIFFIYTKSKVRYLFTVMALIVGLSRIFVGVHYPVDVFVGASIGTIISIISYIYLFNSIILKKVLTSIYKFENKIFKWSFISN